MAESFYAEIFDHSGASYHRAMSVYPTARDEEFDTAVSLFSPKANELVLDVPAGGGYLRNYLPADVKYRGFDFSQGFTRDPAIGHCTETDIAMPGLSVDKAVCLAAMHHVENKHGLCDEIHRCLTSKGTLLIGDVVKGSKEATFLNGFVDRWNSLGHDGDFIQFDRDSQMLHDLGFSVHQHTERYHWRFDSRLDCHRYLRLLFSLDKAPSESELSMAIDELGVQETGSGVLLDWSLGFLIAFKTG